MKLSKKIAMGVLAMSLFAPYYAAPHVYAASSRVEETSEPVATRDYELGVYNSEEFLARIQRILNGGSADTRKDTSVSAPSNDTASIPPEDLSAPDMTPAEMPHPKTSVPSSYDIERDQTSNSYDLQSDAGTYADQDVYHFDWQGTPLSTSLYTISKVSGKRVVINGELSGKVYTSMDATYSQALDYLSKIFNFNWMIVDDAILISTDDTMLQSETFKINYADKTKMVEEFKSIGIKEDKIYANSEYGTISVTGTPYQLYQARQRLSYLDHPVQQCLIIAQLISVSRGKNLNLGVTYNLPTYTHEEGDSMHGKFIDKLKFSASVQASRELSKGQVLARPMIMAQNGQEATINMGDSVPIMTSTTTNAATDYTVEYKDIGTTLKVTPTVVKNNEISVVIDTEISNITNWIVQNGIRAPQISTRKATTVAHVLSGQSLVIGGLMNSKDLDNLSGIPFLMDLPILGPLFRMHTRSKEYEEVFVMITPYIVSENIDPENLLRQAGGGSTMNGRNGAK